MRVSIATAAPNPQAAAPIKWQINTMPGGQPIVFSALASPVVYGPVLVNTAKIAGVWHAVALGSESGKQLWTAPIQPPAFDSWSSPAIDRKRGTVIVPNGDALTAFTLGGGQVTWQARLASSIVNASPVIADDLEGRDRVFITDYSGFSESGQLYCINIDRYDEQCNPYRPGELVWCTTIGATSGNTPAYFDGVVYVACSADYPGPGRVLAFDACATSAPEPLWVCENVKPFGFFGGVSIRDNELGRYVFVASYNFVGSVLSSNLLKIDAGNGQLVWEIEAGRTASTPIPLPDGRIALSAGLYGFGSAPSIQLFLDEGERAQLMWDSALSTWTDTNGNGTIDPGEFFSIGGWTCQPVVSPRAGTTDLFAGVMPVGSPYAAYEDLHRVSLNATPGNPGFLIQTFQNAGSSPAIGGHKLYSNGSNGLTSY